MSQQSFAAADSGPPSQRELTAWSGEWIALWVATATQFAILLWLYLPTLTFRPTTLHDQERLSALARLPLLEALGHVTRGPLRPGDNSFFWLMAHCGHPMLWRGVLLGVFLLTTAFVQYYATKHGGSWLAGVASASCFSFSPTSASVVCWLSGAHIGLCALSLMIYVELGERVLDRASSDGRSVALLFGALAALAVALSFYELAVLAPVLLAMYHRWLAPNARGRKVRWLYVGSALCVVAYVALQIGAAGALHWWSGESPWLLIANALRYNVQNFWLWLWPWGTFGVLVPDTLEGHALTNALCWLFGVIVYGPIWLLRRRDPKSTYGFFWCALFLFGGGALLHFQGTPIAQHHLYLPMLGFTFAGARVTLWVLERAVGSIPRKSLRLVVDGLISVAFFWTFVPLVAAASSTVELWGDEEQLYLTTLENYPENAEVLGRLTRNYLAAAPRAAAPAREPDPWDGVLDSLLMRPIHEPPAALIEKGRELLGRARYVEAGSAFARALEAGARGEEHFEAGKTLVDALLHTDQRESAAALLERLRLEYPQRAELRAVEL